MAGTAVAEFCPGRLRDIREYHRLRSRVLASEVGLSLQSVSNYEHKRQRPTTSNVAALSARFGVPPEYFLRDEAPEPTSSVFFRRVSAAARAAQKSALVLLKWLHELYMYLARFVRFPDVALPKVTTTDVERAAREVREAWHLGVAPMPNMVHLLERAGVIVARAIVGRGEMDAFSCYFGARPVVVLAADKASAARSRQDAAHELAHLLFDGHMPFGAFEALRTRDPIEQRAHRFAGALLLPADEVDSWERPVDLHACLLRKGMWRVSAQSMVSRAYHRRLLTDEQRTDLYRTISWRGWRKVEPLDDTIEPEEPTLLRRAVEMVVTAGRRTKADILRDLALPADVVTSLVGLPSDYFEPDDELLDLL
jgi:Zn-dependent peptidase ImmA (M78 family)/DNA-binding XRE family transcriptional regulator